MKSVIPSLFIAFLLLSSHVHALRHKNQENLSLISLAKSETFQTKSETGNQAIGAAQACFAGFVASIPPSFCYKKGADAGTIPTGCPDGYFRSLALCYKDCKDGYKFVAGVCWEKCKSGYTDTGLTCFKWNWFKSKSYGKDSYIPSSLTNFDSRIPCGDGKYKSGALCYRDCAKIGLDNCGIGACAANGDVCAISIASMVTNFGISLAQSVMFVGTLGASSASSAAVQEGRTAVTKGFAASSKAALKASAKSALASIKKMGTKEFIKKMVKEATKTAGTLVAQSIIEAACEQVGNQVLTKLESNQNNSPALEWQDFDITGISSIVSDCKDQTSDNNRLACAQAVLNTISIVDPTGIVGMATAFMNPTCDGV